jgi:hypothetical protein
VKKVTEENEGNRSKRTEAREWDNPILEDYKEELLRRPSIGPRLITSSDSQRLERLEGLVLELHQRVADLEKKIESLKNR